jgi:hypothetical protein
MINTKAGMPLFSGCFNDNSLNEHLDYLEWLFEKKIQFRINRLIEAEMRLLAKQGYQRFPIEYLNWSKKGNEVKLYTPSHADNYDKYGEVIDGSLVWENKKVAFRPSVKSLREHIEKQYPFKPHP